MSKDDITIAFVSGCMFLGLLTFGYTVFLVADFLQWVQQL